MNATASKPTMDRHTVSAHATDRVSSHGVTVVHPSLEKVEEIAATRRYGCVPLSMQFHPESIMTPDGRAMLENFLAEARRWQETRIAS